MKKTFLKEKIRISMALFLCIETATPVCSVAISSDHQLIGLKESTKKNSHSEIITVFIEELLNENKLTAFQLDAIVVSKGPGSYTGLRIGVSTAKGLCYALGIPLISVNTLYSMAAGIKKTQQDSLAKDHLFCPMIDARRMEVYAALYDNNLNEIRETKAEIIDSDSFQDHLSSNPVLFFGASAASFKTGIEISYELY